MLLLEEPSFQAGAGLLRTLADRGKHCRPSAAPAMGLCHTTGNKPELGWLMAPPGSAHCQLRLWEEPHSGR